MSDILFVTCSPVIDIRECHNDVDLEAVSLCPLSRYDTIHHHHHHHHLIRPYTKIKKFHNSNEQVKNRNGKVMEHWQPPVIKITNGQLPVRTRKYTEKSSEPIDCLKQFKLLKLTVLESEFQTFIMRSQKNDERVQWFVWCLNSLNGCPRVEVEQKSNKLTSVYVYISRYSQVAE